jgi:hypothetical protein
MDRTWYLLKCKSAEKSYCLRFGSWLAILQIKELRVLWNFVQSLEFVSVEQIGVSLKVMYLLYGSR